MTSDTLKSEKIVLGKIQGPQGLKGWVKVYSYARPPENIFTYANWLLHDDKSLSAQKVVVEQFAANGSKLSVKLAGVDDRNIAESLKNAQISVHKQQLESLDNNEFYWHQLIGLTVINSDQQEMGSVKELIETGANDVLVIEGKQNAALVAVPWIPSVVLNTDLAAGVIHVDWQFDDES